MSPKRIEYLVELYFSNTITDTEREELAAGVVHLSDQQVRTLLEKAWMNHVPDTYLPEDISEKIIGSLLHSKSPEGQAESISLFKNNIRRPQWWKIAAAAACILAVLFTILFWPAGPKQTVIAKKPAQSQPLVNDVAPGGQKAVLILADGTQIALDSASSGLLAQQGNTQVNKLPNGEITYNANGQTAGEILYNTMATPMGGMYQLVLPDETRVWLNSASSIRYPTAFGSGERRVEITGEAYFEVAKNPAQPFIVAVNKRAEIKVTGTHFNVNAYDDETDIKTTLMEGSVNVSQGPSSTNLLPGQQAQINRGGAIKKVKDADVEEAIAWKNGNFLFASATLPAVLRQAARWYDLDVVYEGGIPDDKFSGQVPRSVNLSNLLKWMQWSDVHFKLEGRKLIIKN